MKVLICAFGFLFINTFISDYGVDGMTSLVPAVVVDALPANTWAKELQKEATCIITNEKVECCITHQVCCQFIPDTLKYTIKIIIDNNITQGAEYDYGTSNEYCIKFLEFTNTQICAQNKRSNPKESNNFRLGLLLRIDTTSELLVSVRFQEMNKEKRIVLVDSIKAPTDVELFSMANLMCRTVQKGLQYVWGSTDPNEPVTEYLEAVKLFFGWRDLTDKLSSVGCNLISTGTASASQAWNYLSTAVKNSMKNTQAESTQQGIDQPYYMTDEE